MIIVLRADSPPRLTDADRLDRLHAEIDGELADDGDVTQDLTDHPRRLRRVGVAQ